MDPKIESSSTGISDGAYRTCLGAGGTKATAGISLALLWLLLLIIKISDELVQ